MSIDLHVSLSKPIVVEQMFAATRAVLEDLLRLGGPPEIQWEYPPNPRVRAALTDTLTGGVSFYVRLRELSEESSIQFGVSDLHRYGLSEPPFASWSVHNFPEQNVLALAMAIAVAQLTGSKVEDGSGHWFAEEIAEPSELLKRFRISKPPISLRGAILQVDDLLNWKKKRNP